MNSRADVIFLDILLTVIMLIGILITVEHPEFPLVFRMFFLLVYFIGAAFFLTSAITNIEKALRK